MKVVFKFMLGGFVVLSTIIVLVACGASWWAYEEFHKAGPLSEPLTFVVPRGANIGGVADSLKYHGAINAPVLFIYGGKALGQDSKIKAGEYEIPAQLSMRNILDLLVSGKTVQRQVTVREGLTSYEIANLLSEVDTLEQVDLEIPPEGSLLAETYSYSKGENTGDIVKRMTEAMTATIDELWEGRMPNLPLETKEEAIILASIVEKETAVASERKKVAGVFINRLKKGMLLQTDPTVIYALTEGKPKNDGKGPLGRRLLFKDLEVDSPYNTYKYPGLPPTPIANPGRAAIEAVLNPETHEYIYFVADGSGGHAFAKTLAQHNQNVAKWRRIRRSKN